MIRPGPGAAAAGLALLGGLLALPALLRGFPPEAHDSLPHAITALHFSRQLWAGELYPRWLPDLNYGLGAPVLFYYPPVSYYATALLRPLVGPDPYAWQQLGASAALAVAVSGATAWAWLSAAVRPIPAALGGLAYLVLPYHVACDLYFRGALSELWAFAWLPLVLWSVGCVEREARDGPGGGRIGRELAGLALAWALLVATHLPTALVFGAVPLARAAWIARAGRRLLVTARVGGALALGSGLAAIAWLPAWLTQDAIHLSTLGWSGDVGYARQFLFAEEHAFPAFEPVLRGAVLLTGGLGLLALALACLAGPGRRARDLALWTGVGLASLFLMTPASRPVWEALPILQRMQFPWRFAVTLTLSTSALVALSLDGLRLPGRPGVRTWLTGGTLLVGVGLLLRCLDYTAAAALDATGRDRSAASAEVTRAPSHLFFFPVSAYAQRPELREELLRAGDRRYGFERPYRERFGSRPPRARLESGAGEVEVVGWRARRIRLQVTAPEGGDVLVWQLYYPGWRARIAGGGAGLPVSPSRPDGLVRIQVPPGRHVVDLVLAAGGAEWAGRALSLAGLGLTLALVLKPRSRGGAP